MTQIYAILRDTALLLLPMIGLGGWVDGLWGAVGVVVGGLVVLSNLWLAARLTPRLSGWFAGTDSAGAVAGIVMVLKTPLLLAVFTLLAMTFGAWAVLFSLGSFVLAVFVRGVKIAVASPPDSETASAQGS
ncbi:MAG: hypothetical protein EA397_18515 [Deltaproteobacteria bacterium]|nr:MAG: hypothetical protein EA397_18515 [Deltaproteobacteria bacterium]